MPSFLRSDNAGKLLLRITVGGIILFHGVAKLQHGVSWISGMLAQHGFPGFIAYGVYVAEIIAPVMLFVGYRSRLAGLIIAFDMAVAILLVLRGMIFTVKPAGGGWGIEVEAMLLLTGLAIAFVGAGRFSVSGGHGAWD